MTNIYNKLAGLKSKATFVNLFFLLVISVFLTVIGWKFIDPDYGWRLKTGEFILANGIPKSDLFTYTMPSFPRVDHAWPQDILIYLTYESLGRFAQAQIWSIIAIVSLLISSAAFTKLQDKKLPLIEKRRALSFTIYNYAGNVFFVLGFLTLLNYFGVRVQVITWLLFSVMVFLVLKRQFWNRYRVFFPALFYVWALLHGGFASGLSIFLIYIALRAYRKKQVDPIDLIIFIISVLVTLGTPYGPSLWREVWSSVSDTQLRWRINEWQPFVFGPIWSAAFLMGLSGMLIWIFRRNFKIEEIGIFVFFLLQAMLSTRHVPLWTLVAIPLGWKALYFLYQDSLKYEFGEKRFILFYKILWSIVIIIFAGEIIYTSYVLHQSDSGSFYPEKAVHFLRQKEYEGRLFSEYGWGGYLIWKYPEKKVYIDGRMPSWRWEEDIQGETRSAADDYFAIVEGKKDLKNELQKYDIQTVLWRAEGGKRFWDVVANKFKNLLSVPDKDKYSLLDELEDIGWSRVYEDDTAVVYKKP